MESGDIAAVVILALRIGLGPLILRWPLAGGIAALLADTFDTVAYEYFGKGFIGDNYHRVDKGLDTWYYFFEALVLVRGRDNLVRATAALLFGWRFIGMIAFEVTANKLSLVLAPNIFEFFYLAELISRRLWPAAATSKKRLATLLLVTSIPKITQEYLMHYRFEGQTWNFIKENILPWAF